MQLKYIDLRTFHIPAGVLSKHPQGVDLKEGVIVDVTEREARSLNKHRNGKNPCWEELKTRPSRNADKIEEGIL